MTGGSLADTARIAVRFRVAEVITRLLTRRSEG
jgi:hypothetical protein